MPDPIDKSEMPPPPKGIDRDYLTQDLVSALHRAVDALVERTMVERKVARRAAAAIVIAGLKDVVIRD